MSISKEEEQKLLKIIQLQQKVNGACAAGNLHWHRYSSIKEVYDNFVDPVHLIWSKCQYLPDDVFNILINIITHKLPIEKAPQQLLLSREALLNSQLSDHELIKQAIAIEKTEPGSHPWTEFYRIIYYMMLWKLKFVQPFAAVIIVEKMKKLSKVLDLDKNTILNAIKEYLPYERYVQDLKEFYLSENSNPNSFPTEKILLTQFSLREIYQHQQPQDR